MSATSSGQTSHRILAAAEEMIGERGYCGMRVEEVARCVGISKATLFHHFASKEDLFRAVVEQGAGEARSIVELALTRAGQSHVDGAVALVEAYIDLTARHPARTKLLLRESLGDSPASGVCVEFEQLLTRVAEFLDDGRRAGVVADIDSRFIVLSVIGMITFLETSGPMIAPGLLAGLSRADRTSWMKSHITCIVRRLLDPAVPAAKPTNTSNADRRPRWESTPRQSKPVSTACAK